MKRDLTSSDKRKLVPWMALTAFGLSLAASLLPWPGRRVLGAMGVALLVQGLVWFALLHWRTRVPPEFGLFDFLENLVLPFAVGLLPAIVGAGLMSLLGLNPG